jgi:hypothetical protein
VKYDQAGNANYFAATQVVEHTTAVAWTVSGFYQPVDMTLGATTVWNTVKGGSTVPLKFEVFAGPPGSIELTDPATTVASIIDATISCTAGIEDSIEEVVADTTGGTVLRYDGPSGQFIDNWKTPKSPNTCHRITMTAKDGSTIKAYFKLK